MTTERPDLAPSTTEQSTGTDPRSTSSSSSKRNSGLFAFFKWFKPGSRESVATDDDDDSSRSSDSLESVASDKSSGTVASFRYVSPTAYENKILQEKQVPIGPETDTYKARLKQRDKRRENDKNVTLRKKYNLFFNKETLLTPQIEADENSKSLPLMTRPHVMEVEPQKVHRRTNSESSKVKRAGAYVHVKGKRKAPQPPAKAVKLPVDTSSTASLKRKKRAAPSPPPTPPTNEVSTNSLIIPEPSTLSNDYLKLDHGVLKPVKEDTTPKTLQDNTNALTSSASKNSLADAPVSPRPWYKRNSASKEMLTKKENKYEPIERLPEVQFTRNSTLDLTLEDSLLIPEKKKEEKRKSGLFFLANISELDREAAEIIKNKTEYERTKGVKNSNGTIPNEIPEFMKPKEIKSNAGDDSSVSPKRRSARDLIAKFNAITNVTKSSVFGAGYKEKYFGKQTSLDETRQRQEQLLESHKKIIESIDKKKEDRFSPLMKSESASAVKVSAGKDSTPKMERKAWKCPKCNFENDYWRIICHVCSAIKPYFDDFSSSSKSINSGDSKTPELKSTKASPNYTRKDIFQQNSNFERSKTQIGFSLLANYNINNKPKVEPTKKDKEESKVDETSKKEERERLKKMLIEMKNSLPKRKSNILMKQNSRTSVIMETPDDSNQEDKSVTNETVEKTQEEKVVEILIGSTQTIYENIKVKKTDNPKPIKVSSSSQTSAVVRKMVPESSLKKLIENHKTNNVYEPMKVQDFENIYSDKSGNNAARIYANSAQNDELSLFFNVPKSITQTSKSSNSNNNNTVPNHTDTIEINRLLRRLETAIAKGDMTEAAIFAKELAQLKVNCSVIRQKPQGHVKYKGFQIEMYVEDKVSHRGPFPIEVTETQTVAELKQQISREFEIPTEVQRWILGKELATDDNSTLKDHKITDGCPVFLYLVAPEKKPREFLNKTKCEPSLSTQNTKIHNNSTAAISKEENILHETTQQTNKINGSKVNVVPELIKSKIEAPKVVNVIPKSSESSQIKIAEPKEEKHDVKMATNDDIKKCAVLKQGFFKSIQQQESQICLKKDIIKIPLETSSSAAECTKNNESNHQEKPSITTKTSEDQKQLPVSVTEIKVDIKPYHSKYQNENENSRENEKKGDLVRAKSTKVEVLQAPPIIVSQIQQNSAHSVLSSNNATSTPSDAQLNKTKYNPEASTSGRIPKLSDLSIGIYPNLAKLSPQISESKEWECHLCTLLNPDSSNICAVCATVRLRRSLKKSSKKKPAPQPHEDQTYLQLVNLDSADLVTNADIFECIVCFLDVPKGAGVTLRECLHQFCRDCLARTVEFADEAEVKCPYRDEDYSCNIALQDREIKALVSPTIYEQHLAKSMAQAENRMEKTFHCKTPDCKGWCIFEDNVNEFRCPVCRKTNCLTCQAIHMGANCKQYQERMKDDSNMNEEARRTKHFLEEMVEKGEAIACPTCKVILMKKWGCDWLRCSMCKTEICWVTRGPRWGPGGKGDTSGGCQCGLNGVKCHPKCNYCH